MRINDDQPRMHGNPEIRGEHDRHGDGGLSQWGHQDRDHGGYGNPARFDQHGGQTGQGWHSGQDGGINQSAGAMGGNYRDERYDRYGQGSSGMGHGFQGGGSGGGQYGGGPFGQGNDSLHGKHHGQGNDRHFGNEAGFVNQGGDSRSGGFDQGQGLDQHRYGQQGLGTWDSHDHAYRNWRDQQMQAFDRDYDEFRRHRQERFHADFDEWRRNRGSSATGSGAGEQISTTQRPSGSDENR